MQPQGVLGVYKDLYWQRDLLFCLHGHLSAPGIISFLGTLLSHSSPRALPLV